MTHIIVISYFPISIILNKKNYVSNFSEWCSTIKVETGT